MTNNKIKFQKDGWYELTNVFHKTTEVFRYKGADKLFRFQSLKSGGVLGLDTGDFARRYTFKQIESSDALNAEMKQSIERCNRIYEWCSKNTCD